MRDMPEKLITKHTDGRWRWKAYRGGKLMALCPVRGYNSYGECLQAFNDLFLRE